MQGAQGGGGVSLRRGQWGTFLPEPQAERDPRAFPGRGGRLLGAEAGPGQPFPTHIPSVAGAIGGCGCAHVIRAALIVLELN